MKRCVFFMTLLAGTALLTSCEANLKSAPPVTAAFIQSGRREHADARTLTEGRQVFLNRCIACHALPDVSQLDPARIPGVVGWMSGRAHLTAEQKQALIKYLLTVKAQS